MKRNQAFIIKYFSKTRDEFCDHILGETEAKVKDRERLLEEVCTLSLILSVGIMLLAVP